MKQCQVCKKVIVPASGPRRSPVLIIGEFPGKKEIAVGKPFVGASGRVLREELNRCGLDVRRCRVTNLFQHPKGENPNCEELFFKEMLEEAKNRKAILLLGSDVSKKLLDKPVTTVAGLQVKSDFLSAPLIMPSPNPAMVIGENRTIGELRLSLEKFCKLVFELGYLT